MKPAASLEYNQSTQKFLDCFYFNLLMLQIHKDMNTPGNKFHPLDGHLKEYFSVKVSGNWRLIFKFEKEDAALVDYLDYH